MTWAEAACLKGRARGLRGPRQCHQHWSKSWEVEIRRLACGTWCMQVESITSGEIISAAARGDMAKLKKAIDAGNDLDAVDHGGRTALMVGTTWLTWSDLAVAVRVAVEVGDARGACTDRGSSSQSSGNVSTLDLLCGYLSVVPPPALWHTPAATGRVRTWAAGCCPRSAGRQGLACSAGQHRVHRLV